MACRNVHVPQLSLFVFVHMNAWQDWQMHKNATVLDAVTLFSLLFEMHVNSSLKPSSCACGVAFINNILTERTYTPKSLPLSYFYCSFLACCVLVFFIIYYYYFLLF